MLLLSIRGKLIVRRLVLYFYLYLITGASSFQPQEVATAQNVAYELVSPAHKRHGEATYECIDLTTNNNPAYEQIKKWEKGRADNFITIKSSMYIACSVCFS